MKRPPKTLVDRGAENRRGFIGLLAFFSFLIGASGLSDGQAIGLVFIVIALVLGFAASRIKTTYVRRDPPR